MIPCECDVSSPTDNISVGDVIRLITSSVWYNSLPLINDATWSEIDNQHYHVAEYVYIALTFSIHYTGRSLRGKFQQVICELLKLWSERLLCDRASAHGAMGCGIDPSWTHWAISRSSQCSMTGVTNTMVCDILSLGWWTQYVFVDDLGVVPQRDLSYSWS